MITSAAIGTGVTVFQVVVSERLKMTKKNEPPKNDEPEPPQHTFKMFRARITAPFKTRAKHFFHDLITPPRPHRDRRLINEFSTFVAEHPVADEYAEAERWLAGDHGISVRDAEELIVSAINNQRPFSFIRMGDGEGRWMFEFDANSALAAHSNKTARNVWFWNSRTFPPEEFWNELRKSYLDADLVGINPGFRIRFEASQSEHSDVHVLGYVGVILGNQFIFQKKSSPAEWRAIPNWAPMIWNDSGFFQRLFSITKNAHIISPYRNLDKFIHERFGVTIHNVLIPSENHPLVTPISISSPHFPDVYDSIASWIKETCPALVLVAGGVFGKIYSGMIRESGGVAIDIGSVVDSWMGLRTRP